MPDGRGARRARWPGREGAVGRTRGGGGWAGGRARWPRDAAARCCGRSGALLPTLCSARQRPARDRPLQTREGALSPAFHRAVLVVYRTSVSVSILFPAPASGLSRRNPPGGECRFPWGGDALWLVLARTGRRHCRKRKQKANSNKTAPVEPCFLCRCFPFFAGFCLKNQMSFPPPSSIPLVS